MAKTAIKTITRLKRQVRVRKKVRGTTERPRLNVFKSARHIYAQLIDDTNGTTLVAVSTLSETAQDLSCTGNIAAATLVGAPPVFFKKLYIPGLLSLNCIRFV